MGAAEQLQPALPEIAGDVANGLRSKPKSLPPWLFYDARGSRLFEKITRLPEYYLTRAEHEILQSYAREMLESAGSNLALIELGAGTAAKTRTLISVLLRRQLQVQFYPVDVCASALQVAKESLAAISPRVKVHPVVADYTRGLDGIGQLEGRKLALYLGSSIGNFEPEAAISVLRHVQASLHPGDALLLGTDLVKRAGLLRAAYNDKAGVTAQFNKNLLVRINRELGGNFDLRAFRHLGLWNRSRSRMEMYLESTRPQTVLIQFLDLQVTFAEGERIHTENSYKYTGEMVRSLLQDGGFELEYTWMDRRRQFAAHLARVQKSGKR
jgi:L-histidine N-alpha-methyltransferase